MLESFGTSIDLARRQTIDSVEGQRPMLRAIRL